MLLGIDGQAHYSTAQIDRKWTLASAAVTWSIANEGRWSGNPCLKRTSISDDPSPTSPGHLIWAPTMTQSGVWTAGGTVSGVCGFGCKIQDLSRLVESTGTASALTEQSLLQVTEGAMPQFWLALNNDGTLSLWRQTDFGTCVLLANSLGAFSNNTWTFLEVKWVIDDSAGSVTVRANGLPILTYSGRTTNSWTATLGKWTSVKLLQLRSVASPYAVAWLNDFYLCDLAGSGDQLRDFLGDIRISLIIPNGVGNVTGWTPSAGANWAAVDDVPGDDDTTYVSSLAAGLRDSYTYTDLPPGATPLGFQVCHLASGATVAIKPTMRSGGTTIDGPAQTVASSSSYAYRLTPYDTNAVTGARATEAEINAAEFGVLRA